MVGKRSNFERKPRDFYPTPLPAVLPLLLHLLPRTRFAEPCCGDLALVRHLEKHGHGCYWASDIERRSIETVIAGSTVGYKAVVADALTLTVPLQQADCIITNPPWDTKILHPMMEHFIKNSKYTWLLLKADWMHNVGSADLLKYCDIIVSIGRVSWEENGTSGKDNCCWYRFTNVTPRGGMRFTRFIGRTPKKKTQRAKPV